MIYVKINQNGQSVYSDGARFPVGDLDIQFYDFPQIINGEFRYSAKLFGVDGQVKCLPSQTVTAANAEVHIAADQLSAGVLKSHISYIIGGKEVRRYNIEDLAITQLDDNIFGQPRLDALEKAVKELGKIVESLNGKVENLNKNVDDLTAENTKLKNDIAALARFAFDDFKANVYLNGTDSADEFLKNYGLTTVNKADLEGK